ncbi:MAG: hypothetical protein RIS85_1846 [Pseudomonadota bacterium]
MIDTDLAEALHRRGRSEDGGNFAHPPEIQRTGIERFDHQMAGFKIGIGDGEIGLQTGGLQQQAIVCFTLAGDGYTQGAGGRRSPATSGQQACAQK